MNTASISNDERRFSRNMMTSFIQISALVLLVSACALVVKPFAAIVAWGIILAVAIYPLHARLSAMLGGRPKWSATIIALVGLTLLLVPGWFVVDSTLETAQALRQQAQQGGIEVPPPNEQVRGWPVVGERLYGVWSDASDNLEETLEKHKEQVRKAGEWLFSTAGGLATGMLHFVASIIIAAVFLMFPRQGYDTTAAICERISTGRGEHVTDLMVSTIRSVTNGVLGVAVIQAVLAGIGFALIGLPAAGLLTLVILVTAIMQIPAIIIMLPLIVWVFSFASGGAATIFAIYAIAVALSDNVLKPLLLGRGVDLPVLVVLIGAIGGMIQFGIIGLFLGAVILGLGYQLISEWISGPTFDEPDVAGEAAS